MPAKVSAAPAEPSEPGDLLYPMFVVPIRTMIDIANADAPLPSHEEVADKLVRWHESMGPVTFFSHTWLGYKHPDPSGDKQKLIAALLRGFLDGSVAIKAYWISAIVLGTKDVPAKQCKRDMDDSYVWLDYLSVPQAHRENQLKAIQSINRYIALSSKFIVLAGAWSHVDDGSVRDVRAWAERGWCRLEFLASALSPVRKAIIIAESPTCVFTYGPDGKIGRSWTHEVVGRGQFTVESDRIALGPTVEKMIDERVAQADREHDLVTMRFLLARKRMLLDGTGLCPPRLPYAEWMQQMRFNGPTDGDRDGVGPLKFAAVENRADLVSSPQP